MNTGIEHELRKAVEARCRPNIDDIDARELLKYLDGMRKALQELELASDARIAELEAALAFYADPTRYWGPNQILDSPDAWSERAGLQAYRLDVNRDQGAIARNALKG